MIEAETSLMKNSVCSIFIFAVMMVFPVRAMTIVNGSFESPAGFSEQETPGWDGDDQPVHHNAWGTLMQGQFGAPAARAGRQWGFISSDGFKDRVSMWTVWGVVEENREYVIGFLAGKCDTDAYTPDHHFEVGIWAGDSEGPAHKLDSKSFDDPGRGQVEEHALTFSSGKGHAGEVLYLVFSKPFENQWSQILIDKVRDVSLEQPPVKVRIAAYNVLFGNWGTPERIGEMFKPYDLDIIGFSEVPGGDWTMRVGHVLGMKYAYVGKVSSAFLQQRLASPDSGRGDPVQCKEST